jgi:competence ComEA-like helix-hairpin-helix protein
VIWRFHFSQRTLLWLLGIAFIVGAGYRLAQQFFSASMDVPVGIVTGTPEAVALRQRADSIMEVRARIAAAPINVNRASAHELERLPGIGPVIAARIEEYRDEHGPFASLDDLDKVPGIGPKRLEAIRGKCMLTDDSSTAAQPVK